MDMRFSKPICLQILFKFQVARLNSSYPGGLASYIKTARELLADSKAGNNPFEGFTPSVRELIARLIILIYDAYFHTLEIKAYSLLADI